jgi:DNA repair exonuclease SbcCD nuclease subunit
MKYRDKIFKLLCEDTDTNFDAWVLSHEDTLERVAILRQAQQIARETLGLIMPKRFESLEDLAEFLDYFEEMTLKFKKEDDAFDRKIEEMERQAELKRITDYRTFIIDSVLAKIPKIEFWLEEAGELIKAEKEYGEYDPKNWERLPDLL